MKPQVTVDVVSDVMCPWCLIGKRRLEKALASVNDVIVTVRWRPFLLDPTIPPEGRDRREYLEAKFGGPERAKAIYANIEAAGRAEGIDFAFDRIERSPKTLDAHRLIRWAGSLEGQVQDRLVEALFAAFFLEGRDVGDHAVLRELAGGVGMDGTIVADLLASDRERAVVEQEIETARQIGVTGVPCFIFDGREGVMGAQDPATLADAIRRAASTQRASPAVS